MRDELEDTEKPWYDEQSSKRPEGEPLKNADHDKREIPSHLRRQGQGDNHDGQKDETTIMVSLLSLLGFSEVADRKAVNMMPTTIDSTLILVFSALMNTLTRQ